MLKCKHKTPHSDEHTHNLTHSLTHKEHERKSGSSVVLGKSWKSCLNMAIKYCTKAACLLPLLLLGRWGQLQDTHTYTHAHTRKHYHPYNLLHCPIRPHALSRSHDLPLRLEETDVWTACWSGAPSVTPMSERWVNTQRNPEKETLQL